MYHVGKQILSSYKFIIMDGTYGVYMLWDPILMKFNKYYLHM